MTTVSMPDEAEPGTRAEAEPVRVRRWRLSAAWVGGAVLALMTLACFGTLYWSIDELNAQQLGHTLEAPASPLVLMGLAEGDASGGWMGTDRLGRSVMWRALLGGAISLGIGISAALITMFIGTAWGMIAGYAGGRTDAVMMRIVDVLYGLPYILLVVLLSVAIAAMPGRLKDLAAWFETRHVLDNLAGATRWLSTRLAANPVAVNLGALLVAIGAVSWLTLARVVRGQVLSLKGQPFVEAARASGAGAPRILFHHVLPNLIGPMIVYTTLTVPQAVLQESFLSFLGIGVRPPLPSWGNMASEGLSELNPIESHAWLLAWPCALLAVTLLALNFVGDGLRDKFDPRGRA